MKCILIVVIIGLSSPAMADETSDKNSQTSELAGISAALGPSPTGTQITKVLSGGPADKNGLREGDVITKIDDNYVKGLSDEQILSKIRGPVGSHVRLIVVSKSGHVNEYDIVREKIIATQSNAPTTNSAGCAEMDKCQAMRSGKLSGWFTVTNPYDNKPDKYAYEKNVDGYAGSSMEEKDEYFKEMTDFISNCQCYITAKKIQPQADLGMELVGKWKIERAKLVKAAEEDKARAEVRKAQKQQMAAASQAEQDRLNKMAATKECKAAKAKAEYCGSVVYIRSYERVIEHEQKVGQQSGVVNKATLHTATSAKINLEEQLPAQQSAYQTITGQKIDRKSCHLVEGTGNQVKAGADVAAEVKRYCGYDPM